MPNQFKPSRLGLTGADINGYLSKTELEYFSLKYHEKGDMLYADEPSIVVLKKGRAKLSFLEHGEEFILYQLKDNGMTVLDEVCALEFLEPSCSLLLKVSEAEMLLSNENFAKEYSQILLEIILLQRQINRSVIFEDARGRIATFLIELAQEQNLTQNGYFYIFLPFSLKILSSFVGLRRQSASTIFNELIKEGTLAKLSQHEFLILDKDRLQSYTNS